MSQMKLDAKEPEFQWGKKRAKGGAKKDIQFYDSFTFDGIDYTLYDCVYLYKTGEVYPYIGKIVKIWEQPDGKRKVKILWFFLANEIMTYLGDNECLENEIFLASGEGVGASNINPLEAIAGKCYVVCNSKDERNLQLPKEAMDKADYIFNRTFDVGNFTISDKIPDKIVGTEVKYLLNREGDWNPNVDKAEDSAVLRNTSKPESLRLLENDKKDEKFDQIMTPTSKSEVIEKKHLHDGKDTRDENGVSKLKNNLVNEGETRSNGPLRRAEEHLQSSKRNALPSDSGEKPSKKMRPDDNSVKLPGEVKNKIPTGARKLLGSFDDDDDNDVVQTNKESFDKVKLSERKVLQDASLNKGSSEMVKLSDKKRLQGASLNVESSEKVRLSDKRVLQDSSLNNDAKVYNKFVEVTRRPVTESNKWFKATPWDSRFRSSDEQGKLVFLENLDPSYTSGEIEDIVYHALKLHCSAKVIQQGTFQSPHNGQAYVIFKTADAAEQAVHQIDQGCLMLPGGRPLLASRGMLRPPPKSSTHIGHLVVDKLKLKQHDEWRKAVATSHCSQPNTIEYEMSMDWILLQEKSADWFRQLYKTHGAQRNQARKSLNLKAE